MNQALFILIIWYIIVILLSNLSYYSNINILMDDSYGIIILNVY